MYKLVFGLLGILSLSACSSYGTLTPPPSHDEIVPLTTGRVDPVYPPYCWIQPPGNPLWYPCNAETVKDKECLNLMELAMKAVEGDIKDGNKPKDSTVHLWNRAKSTCWSDLKDLQEKHYH